MSLDRNHPVFVGHPSRDRTPPRFRSRFLDDEIGSRTFSWRYRRYICILGDQGSGRRSLARRFFQDRGELQTDGNFWLRGRIPLTTPFPRGELDLLIRIVPSEQEESAGDRRFLISIGMHGNASLAIFAFTCYQLESVTEITLIIGLFYVAMVEDLTPCLTVGTKCDLRPTDRDSLQRHMSEADIRRDIQLFFIELLHHRYLRPPQYVECSVLDNVEVHSVINEALSIIIA